MTKIEELIFKTVKNASGASIFQQTEKIMKEYAEFYAHRCLEIAESHLPTDVHITDIYPTEIKLPEHE
jgi:hypothetical protein